MIKYGIKIWNINKNWFPVAVELFKTHKIDFIELYLAPEGASKEELTMLKDIPVSIHAPHYSHGFNLFELNNEQIDSFKKNVIETADYLNSNFIVVHPGIGSDKEMFRNNSFKIFDKRILIESMVKIGFVGKGGNRMDEGVGCFGHSLEQLEFINKKCGFGICLDLAHSTATAVSLGIDYKEFLMSLINNLNPNYFHISGGCQDSEEDDHLDVFDGNLDIKWMKKALQDRAKDKDIYLVFETLKVGNKLENDVKNIDYFKNL